MGQLDEVSQSIGKIQGTLEAHGQVHNQILLKLESFERNLSKKFDEYDEHIEKLNAEMEQRRGARAVLVGAAGVLGAGFVKIIEAIFHSG